MMQEKYQKANKTINHEKLQSRFFYLRRVIKKKSTFFEVFNESHRNTENCFPIKKNMLISQKNYYGKTAEHSRLSLVSPWDTKHLMDFQFCSIFFFLCFISALQKCRVFFFIFFFEILDLCHLFGGRTITSPYKNSV